MKKILHVVGARPNFPKIAPIIAEINKYPDQFNQILIHTGQHYDTNMSKIFFDELEIPSPEMLKIEEGSVVVQISSIMKEFEKVILKHKPDYVLVVGDVNSTLACSIVCSKMNIKCIHVESGLRSNDKSMPEEINRIITDHISDVLFTSCLDGNRNLKSEGIDSKNVYFVGNVMIDTLVRMIDKSKNSKILETLNVSPKNYILVTLHRPCNVDETDTLKEIISNLNKLTNKIDVIFPVHPRTNKQIKKYNFDKNSKIKFIDPLSYIDFLCTMSNTSLVITDSGGVQEETSYLNIPCLTLRPNTERPVTIEEGTNQLVNINQLLTAIETVLSMPKRQNTSIEYWDGLASERIVKVLKSL